MLYKVDAQLSRIQHLMECEEHPYSSKTALRSYVSQPESQVGMEANSSCAILWDGCSTILSDHGAIVGTQTVSSHLWQWRIDENF
jgi:hypothetical protein